MNTSSVFDETLTRAFRLHMSHFDCAGYPGHYEYVDGELWYMGYPLENRITSNERKCLEYVLKLCKSDSDCNK